MVTADATRSTDAVASRSDRFVNLLLRLPTSIRSRLRVAWWRLMGARIGSRCRLEAVAIPRNPWDVELADCVALDRGVVLLSTGTRGGRRRIQIGLGCYINRDTIIDASESIAIGADVMIGPGCYITDHDHGMRSDVPIPRQPLSASAVEIGNDVWLGARVTILKGVVIGDGAVVGAGSVVTRSIPREAIYVGVPARRIGERQ